MKLIKVALGSIWDPIAVKSCLEVGENAVINLNFGSKISASTGGPIIKKVLVKKIVKKAYQKFGSSSTPERTARRRARIHGAVGRSNGPPLHHHQHLPSMSFLHNVT